MNYETCTEIEMVLAKKFDYRQNLIIPNVSWGLCLHECDLLMLSKNGYATEIEIKVNKYDLLKDKEKKHNHYSNKIKRLYFAIPEKLNKEEIIKEIPKRAGIIVIDKYGRRDIIRKSEINKNALKFTDEERFNLSRLGALRIWNLKEKILKLKNNKKK